jgi:hypothetical protein
MICLLQSPILKPMDRMGSPKRLKENNNGSRRRQGVKPVFKSNSTKRPKNVGQTKKRRGDGKSPEKD